MRLPPVLKFSKGVNYLPVLDCGPPEAINDDAKIFSEENPKIDKEKGTMVLWWY
jgi:hypothetical protein